MSQGAPEFKEPAQAAALREALQELERLRHREARTLRENTALLGALSAIAGSDGPHAALHALLVSTCASLRGDAAVILRRRRRAEECVVEYATLPELLGAGSVALAGLTAKSRRVVDLAQTGWFSGWPAFARYGCLVAAPIALNGEAGAAILCLSREPASFGPGCAKLLRRIADLAGGALEKLALSERQALLAAVIEGSAASIAIADAHGPDAPLIYVNPAFEALTGYSRAEALALDCRLLSAEQDDGPEGARLRAALAGRRRGHFVLRNRRRDGTPFWNQLAVDVVPDEGTAAHYIVATQMDVTDRIRTRERLQRMNDRLAAIAAVSDTWFWEFDADLRWRFLSESVERAIGLPHAEIIGQRLPDMVRHAALAGRGDWAALSQSILSLEPIQGFTFRAPPAAGRDAIIQINGAPFYTADGLFAGYRGVGTDVTEIISAKEEAEFASRAKSDFLATISHELRTPLTAILGNLELLAPMLTTEPQRALLAEVERGGLGLDAVLSDVLDLARLDNGRVALETARFVPAELLDKAAALHRTAAEDKGLRLHSLGIGAMHRARWGDARRILQMLHHLIGNAIKFTPAGSVTLRIDASAPEHLTIEVEDTGVGIAPEHQRRVFDSFVQLDTRVGRSHGGSGLGLALCRQLVRLMQGEITLDSATGHGTRMRVVLPVAISPAASAAPPAPARAVDHLAGLRVLVADDTVANRKILSLMLGRLGAECQAVPDGTAALAAWREGMFDLGLFDINMPGLDGIALIREIRAAEARGERARLPAIAVTANAMPHQVADYRAAGFDACVGKPFSRERLLDAIWEQVAAGALRARAACGATVQPTRASVGDAGPR